MTFAQPGSPASDPGLLRGVRSAHGGTQAMAPSGQTSRRMRELATPTLGDARAPSKRRGPRDRSASGSRVVRLVAGRLAGPRRKD